MFILAVCWQSPCFTSTHLPVKHNLLLYSHWSSQGWEQYFSTRCSIMAIGSAKNIINYRLQTQPVWKWKLEHCTCVTSLQQLWGSCTEWTDNISCLWTPLWLVGHQRGCSEEDQPTPESVFEQRFWLQFPNQKTPVVIMWLIFLMFWCWTSLQLLDGLPWNFLWESFFDFSCSTTCASKFNLFCEVYVMSLLCNI